MSDALIRDTVRRATQTMFRCARSVSIMFRLITYAFRQTTAVVQQLPERAALACAPGCAFCCYHPVDITPPEAFAIIEYLRTTLSSAASETAYARIATQASRINGLSYEEHAQARIPCALLVDGQCSVYPCRPFACRAWNSTSAACCETIFTHGNPVIMLPPLDMGTYEAVWEVAHGVTDGLQRSRLDGKSYELHSILQRVLTTPEAAQRWTQGEDVFAGCTLGAFTA
ncbi:MAG TPA: hypothetical protein VIH59_23230 [Candidatus Tectomicrobia bacterium]